MATEYKLSYTAAEIDSKLGKIDGLAGKNEIPTKLSDLVDDKGYLTTVPSEYITETELEAKGYLTEHQSLSDYVKTADLGDLATKDTVAKTDLTTDVQTSLNKADTALQSYTETDPTVPAWAKAATKPTYTASEVGADVGGTASNLVTYHNTDTNAHTDIREDVNQLRSNIADKMQLIPEFVNSIDECTDTSKLYVLPDGFIYAYMLTEKEVEGDGYTNLLPSSTKGSDQVNGWQEGKGYTQNARLSGSSGSVSTNYTAVAGMCASGFIPATVGDVIRIKNFSSPQGAAAYVITYSGTTRVANVAFPVEMSDGTWPSTEQAIPSWMTVEGEKTKAGVTTITLDSTNFGTGFNAVRFSGKITDDTIVTVNEEIKESNSTIIKEEAWASTGHAFVPADYEGRIIEVEERAFSNTERIISLEKAAENGGGVDDTEATALRRIKEWDKPVYDYAPLTLIPDNRAKPALPESEKTVAAVYAKYRALMEKHPEYITETNLGLSSSSDTFVAVDMLRFDFKEPDGRVEAGYVLNETKPKIIFMTGVHNEYAGIYGLYYALEEIAENPDFKDIRRNAHIIVIPCANPFCLTSQTAIEGWTMSHVNANGVAIHNNFGVEFGTTNANATLGAYNYGGTEPYSEPETQYIDKVMRENSDAVAFVSCHNFNYGVKFAADFVWMSSATAHMCNLGFRLIDKLTTAWMDKYGDTYTTNFDAYRDEGTETYAAGDYRIGRATFSTSAGTEQLNATKYGILGTNLEIGDRIRVVSGNTTYTSETMTHGAEVYANFMRTLLWNYDHKDKKEYAPNLPWSE